MTYLASHLASLTGPDGIVPKVPDGSFWLPAVVDSNGSNAVDGTFMFILVLSSVVTIGVVGAMIYLVNKYRATSRAANQKPEPSPEHNTTLEITWSAIPLVLCILIFVWGFKGFVDIRTPPKDTLDLKAQGQKWKWIFTYPTGYQDDRLHVPAGENVKVTINSVDVLHSLYLPNLRQKMDAVPGRFTTLWFKADKAGTYPIFCAEYCGTSHSDMLSELVVHESRAAYDKWFAEAVKPPSDPVEHGKLLFEKKGCPSCHTVDGTPKVGPSLKGVWGKTESFEDGGSAVVDENYVRQSLMEPSAKIVKGFAPGMPTFKGQLKDAQIDALIAYLKSVK